MTCLEPSDQDGKIIHPPPYKTQRSQAGNSEITRQDWMKPRARIANLCLAQGASKLLPPLESGNSENGEILSEQLRQMQAHS